MMAKKSEQTDTNRPQSPAERATQARDAYFRELYEAWQDVTKQSADAHRGYQERVAALSSSDDIAHAQAAARDASRGYALAVHEAASVPAPDVRGALAAERDKYCAAVEALNDASRRAQQKLTEEQQAYAAQWNATLGELYEGYAASFQRFAGTIADTLGAAGDPIDPALAYSLGRQLVAVSSHAAWLQRTAPRRPAAG
jgi:hypothetical protein